MLHKPERERGRREGRGKGDQEGLEFHVSLGYILSGRDSLGYGTLPQTTKKRRLISTDIKNS